MKTIVLQGGLYLDASARDERILFFGGEAKSWMDYVLITPHTITAEVPDDYDPRPAAVAVLEAKRQALRAEFEAAMTEIATRIAKLTAIGYEEAV